MSRSAGAWAAGLVGLVVYAASMRWGVHWGDSAEFALRAAELELSPIARGYPLHRLLSWVLAAVVGDPAVGANLVSVLGGAVSVGLLFRLVQRLTELDLAAWGAAAALLFAHTYWGYACVAEVYSLHTAFMLGLLLAADGLDEHPERAAWWLGLLLGASLLHHRLIAFVVPGLVVWAWSTTAADRRLAVLSRTVAGGVLGAVPFVLLCVFASRAPPPDEVSPALWWFRDVFMGGDANAQFLIASDGKSALESAVYLGRFVVLNFPFLALPLCAWGLLRGHAEIGRGRSVALVTLLLVQSWFPFRYDWTGDQYAFLVPLYPLLALAVGLGLARLYRRRQPLAMVACLAVAILPPLTYATLAFTSLATRVLPGLTPTGAAETLWPPTNDGIDPTAHVEAVLDAAEADLGGHEGDWVVESDWGDGMVIRYLHRDPQTRPGLVSLIWAGGAVKPRPWEVRPRFVTVLPIHPRRPAPLDPIAADLEPVAGSPWVLRYRPQGGGR